MNTIQIDPKIMKTYAWISLFYGVLACLASKCFSVLLMLEFAPQVNSTATQATLATLFVTGIVTQGTQVITYFRSLTTSKREFFGRYIGLTALSLIGTF